MEKRTALFLAAFGASACDDAFKGCDFSQPPPAERYTDSPQVDEELFKLREEFREACELDGPGAPGSSLSGIVERRGEVLSEHNYPTDSIGWRCHFPRSAEAQGRKVRGEFEELTGKLPLQRGQDR